MQKYLLLFFSLIFVLSINAQEKLEPKIVETKRINSSNLSSQSIKNNPIIVNKLVKEVKVEQKVEAPIIKTEEKKTPDINKEFFIPVSYKYDTAKDKKVKGNIYTDGVLFCYQVSSSKVQKSAKKEADNLIKKNFPAYVQEFKIKKIIWYRVRIGDFDKLSEAEASLKLYNKLIKK